MRSSIDPQTMGITKALKRAAKEARRLAKMHGTKVWYIRDGKIVGEKP